MLIEQPQGHITTPIMPARPLCFGGPCAILPACQCCVYATAECYVEGVCLRKRDPRARLTATISGMWWAISDQEYDLTMARDFVSELRERVDALEWLVECVDVAAQAEYRWVHGNPKTDAESSWQYHAWATTKDYLAHARKEAGV